MYNTNNRFYVQAPVLSATLDVVGLASRMRCQKDVFFAPGFKGRRFLDGAQDRL
jgi:hypothetical protein